MTTPMAVRRVRKSARQVDVKALTNVRNTAVTGASDRNSGWKARLWNTGEASDEEEGEEEARSSMCLRGRKYHRLEDATLSPTNFSAAQQAIHTAETASANRSLREGVCPWPAPDPEGAEPRRHLRAGVCGWVFHTSALSSTRRERAHQGRHPREREPRAAGVSLRHRPLSVHRRRARQAQERLFAVLTALDILAFSFVHCS